MEFKTDGREVGVGEFYRGYQRQLPQLVMVNQGYYDDIGEDTFSREQILRVHTTTRYQRVLVQSYVGRVPKTYSMSLNYPREFCVVECDGNLGCEQDLHAILRENTLLVKIRLASHQTIVINGVKVPASKVPDMELVQTFEEICFLGNDIDKTGVMSPYVTKIPLCYDKMTFQIVTGAVGWSTRDWNRYLTNLNKESKAIPYEKEQGVEDFAQYDAAQVQMNTDISNLEPVLYTNLSFLLGTQRGPSQIYKQTVDDEEDYDAVGPVREAQRTGKATGQKAPNGKPSGFLKELSGVMKNVGKNISGILPSQTKKSASGTTYEKPYGPITKEKPKVAPKPKIKGKRTTPESKDNAEEDVYEIYAEDNNSTNNTNLSTIEEPKVYYDPVLDYDTALEIRRPLEGNDYLQTEVSSTTKDDKKMDKADTGYINTNSMAIVTPISQQDTVYENLPKKRNSELRPKKNISRSISQPAISRQSTRQTLSRNDIQDLSIEEVGEYLKMLKLDASVEAFRDNQIDGKLLVELTDDILKTEFQLTGLKILKLKNFIRDGHIPQ